MSRNVLYSAVVLEAQSLAPLWCMKPCCYPAPVVEQEHGKAIGAGLRVNRKGMFGLANPAVREWEAVRGREDSSQAFLESHAGRVQSPGRGQSGPDAMRPRSAGVHKESEIACTQFKTKLNIAT